VSQKVAEPNKTPLAVHIGATSKYDWTIAGWRRCMLPAGIITVQLVVIISHVAALAGAYRSGYWYRPSFPFVL